MQSGGCEEKRKCMTMEDLGGENVQPSFSFDAQSSCDFGSRKAAGACGVLGRLRNYTTLTTGHWQPMSTQSLLRVGRWKSLFDILEII